ASGWSAPPPRSGRRAAPAMPRPPTGSGPRPSASPASPCPPRSVRELREGEEEVVNLPDRLGEQLEAGRLGDVGVGVQPVAGQDVPLGLPGREYHQLA